MGWTIRGRTRDKPSVMVSLSWAEGRPVEPVDRTVAVAVLAKLGKVVIAGPTIPGIVINLDDEKVLAGGVLERVPAHEVVR